MTKTNRFTLIATFLLGVLLYTILRFAHDLNVARDGRAIEAPPTIADSMAPSRLRIETTTDLASVLDEIVDAADDFDVQAALIGYTDWGIARGFTGRDRLFATISRTPTHEAAADRDADLRAASDSGSAIASQTLAAQLLFTDPVGAIALFGTAAEQGSTFALLRIGSLLDALATAAPGKLSTGSALRGPVARLTERGVDNSLRLTALGYVIAAIRDGGPPIVDHALLNRMERLVSGTTNDERVAVCEWSEQTLLDIARGRVRRGNPPVTTVAPPVFFSVPDLSDQLPCRRTASPIESLMDVSNCTMTPVRNAADEDLILYICPAG